MSGVVMKALYKIFGLVVGLILVGGAVAYAQESDILPEGGGHSYMDMVEAAQNIVFAQITAVSSTTVEASVSQALKGRATDKIIIAGFKDMRYMGIKDPSTYFKPGEDAFFFLNATMVGSLPYEPIKNSVVVKVVRNKVNTSIITPTDSAYFVDMDFELFKSYLSNLVAKSNGQMIESVFLGKLVEKLEAEAGVSGSALAPTYLTMVLQLNPSYDNLNVLLPMLTSSNLNSRVLALRAVTSIATRLPKPDTQKAVHPKKGKKAKGKGTVEEEDPYERVFQAVVAVLKTDKSRLMQSLSATSLSIIHDDRVVRDLAEMVDSFDMSNVETCEVVPKPNVEPPKKAVIRAIVEFEGDVTLDVMERELRKDEVAIFRLILDVFRDYNDMNLNLLLLDLLQDRNFLPRQIAILEYFRAIKDQPTIDNLIELFKSPQVGSEFIRKSIVEVFEDYGDKVAVPFLIESGLHDPSAVVRQASARALGKIGDPRAVEAFKDIYFKEPNRLAREFYVEALSQIKSKKAYDILVWLKEKERDAHMLQQIEFALKKSKYLSIQ
jgi:hypothetical protein